ncbi:MAG: ATP-binding protein [Hyphomicrobiales bacterium]|nr:ATP-binding protein [Hyphomicrobiales bacterium]
MSAESSPVFADPEATSAPAARSALRRALDAPLLLAIGLAVVAGVADPDVARDIVAVGGVVAALAIILRRLRDAPARRTGTPLAEGAAAAEAGLDADARSHLVALAAHEIRTPLTGIVGLVELLGETALTAEQTAYVRALRGSGDDLLRLVDGYLGLSRMEAGAVEPTPVPTLLAAVVEEVVELLAPSAQAKGLEIVGHVAASLAAPVSIDPLLLRQVLINLAGNAVKFTETGGVVVEIERPAGVDDHRVRFRVRDTGVGIAPEEASRIFDAWERIETEGLAQGAGLGLAIARGIVERMGGAIALTSALGEGSTFAFDLDLPPLEAVEPSARPLRGRRIAVLSRAAIEPPVLIRRLHALGAEAWLVDAAEALVGRDGFDVVLVDAEGGDDPAETLARLRAAGVEAPAVILITPLRRAALPALRAAGFAAHLVRPVRPASLARVVALAAGRSAEPPALAPSPPPPTAADGCDVLLVDDNEINALLGRAALEHAGHRVRVETDGASALAAIEAAQTAGRPFAAVLMDLHMPGLDGFSAIRALRAAEPPGVAPTLVVALTADATPQAAERAEAAGADAVMVKPIDRDRLARLLAEPGAARRAPRLRA